MSGRRYKKVDSEVIFVDESGDPGLGQKSIDKSPYYTIGFVYCKNLPVFKKQMKRLLRKVHKRKQYPRHLEELKFHLPKSDLIKKGYDLDQLKKYETKLPLIREQAIEIICNEGSGVFGATLDKNSRKCDTWTTERIGNYIFAQTLIRNVMNNIQPRHTPVVLYDKGRLSAAKNEAFKDYVVRKDAYLRDVGISEYEYTLPKPDHRSSYTEPGIWAADIVAGAFRYKHMEVDSHYADLLATKYIDGGEKLYWP